MTSETNNTVISDFNELLREAGSIWDVLDRSAGWRLAASTLIEREARSLTELWNEQEGRERFKTVKRGA